jgi:hypothetical protein
VVVGTGETGVIKRVWLASLTADVVGVSYPSYLELLKNGKRQTLINGATIWRANLI